MNSHPLRSALVTAVVVLPAVLLAGCGSNDSSEGSGASTTSSTTPSSTTTSSSSSTSPDNETSLGRTRLTVVTRPNANGPATTRTLTCNPAGGTVADPGAACRQIAHAGGTKAFEPAQRSGMACTQQFAGPDVARITGTVQGRTVSLTLRQTDGCRIAQWNRLSKVLGSTAGGD